MTEEDLDTLNLFLSKYPTWWYKIGVCEVTRDFDCAPQGHSPEIKYIENGLWPDDCFTCDHKGTVSEAILHVMEEIEEAIKEAQ